MFRRPALYHPYKSSAHKSPAGFRLADYVPRQCFNLFQGPNFTDARSPDPSPLSSPVRGPQHPEDDPPPTTRLADLFTANVFGSPKRPSTPTPDCRPNVISTTVREKNPLPHPPPPRRKVKKHPSFKNHAHRSGVLPPHRRSQQLKEKRDAVRKRLLDLHEHRVARARDEISRLRREAEALMKPEHMDDEDRIFLEQLGNLHFDHKLKHDLEACRQQLSRAADEAEERRKEHEARDEEAAKMWGGKQDEEALEEQKRKVEEFVRREEGKREARHQRVEEAAMRADEERRRAHEEEERKIREEQERLFHEEMARKVKEQEERRRREGLARQLRVERERQLREARDRRLREEVERLHREERVRQLREQVERARRAERECRLQEERQRKLREEVERLRQEAHERLLREERERQAREERERQARFRAEQAHRAAQDDQVRQLFVLYAAKWNELRTSNSLPPINVREMPWPVFGVVSSADQITYHDVRTFLFHPLRPGVEGKTARDRVKSEVLRFHPDKFNTRVIPKIEPSQQAVAQEIAGAVARILTTIMMEEAEQ